MPRPVTKQLKQMDFCSNFLVILRGSRRKHVDTDRQSGTRLVKFCFRQNMKRSERSLRKASFIRKLSNLRRACQSKKYFELPSSEQRKRSTFKSLINSSAWAQLSETSINKAKFSHGAFRFNYAVAEAVTWENVRTRHNDELFDSQRVKLNSMQITRKMLLKKGHLNTMLTGVSLDHKKESFQLAIEFYCDLYLRCFWS